MPICPFTPMANEKKIMAKAWDNRYGCGLAIELLKELKDETLPNTLYSGATVQEEVGLRGAQNRCKYDSTRHFLCAGCKSSKRCIW